MRRNLILWVVLGCVAEKILQHGLTAQLFIVNIDGIGEPDIGSGIPLRDPALAVLNCFVTIFLIWALLDIWRVWVN